MVWDHVTAAILFHRNVVWLGASSVEPSFLEVIEMRIATHCSNVKVNELCTAFTVFGY